MQKATYKPGNYQLSLLQRAIELSRPWLLLACYIIFAVLHIWWVAIPVAFAVCMAAFIQMHDLTHSALGLSKKGNNLMLTLSALLLLKSGHSIQATHLRHHGQCLGEDDPEGEPAKWALKEVFLNGPYHIFTLRFASLRIAPNTRRIQLIETAITAMLLIGFIMLYYFTGSAAGLVYWAVVFVLSALLPLWASYIPHRMASRNPARLAGARLSNIWTPMVASFAFHHLHHAYPKVPTVLLPKAAKELPEPEDDDHH